MNAGGSVMLSRGSSKLIAPNLFKRVAVHIEIAQMLAQMLLSRDKFKANSWLSSHDWFHYEES